jgi:predicted transglutaminase-like cysteine proteinase
MAADDLRLAGVHDGQSGDDQAVVTARIDGDWLVLDNRYLRMLTDAEAINLTALFALGSEPDALSVLDKFSV